MSAEENVKIGLEGLEDGGDYVGIYTRNQAEGAIANGSRIVKNNGEEEDATPDGTGGIVIGSLDARDLPSTGVNPKYLPVSFAYFVEWENRPGVAVGVIDGKLKEAD